CDELAELVEGRLSEDGSRLADEVLPELPGLLLDLGRRGEPHQTFLEALLLKRPCEGLLDHEDRAMSAAAQNLRDPDAVIGRPECALGEEDDGLAVGLAHARGA